MGFVAIGSSELFHRHRQHKQPRPRVCLRLRRTATSVREAVELDCPPKNCKQTSWPAAVMYPSGCVRWRTAQAKCTQALEGSTAASAATPPAKIRPRALQPQCRRQQTPLWGPASRSAYLAAGAQLSFPWPPLPGPSAPPAACVLRRCREWRCGAGGTCWHKRTSRCLFGFVALARWACTSVAAHKLTRSEIRLPCNFLTWRRRNCGGPAAAEHKSPGRRQGVGNQARTSTGTRTHTRRLVPNPGQPSGALRVWGCSARAARALAETGASGGRLPGGWRQACGWVEPTHKKN